MNLLTHFSWLYAVESAPQGSSMNVSSPRVKILAALTGNALSEPGEKKSLREVALLLLRPLFRLTIPTNGNMALTSSPQPQTYLIFIFDHIG